jgi:hypothetical protein
MTIRPGINLVLGATTLEIFIVIMRLMSVKSMGIKGYRIATRFCWRICAWFLLQTSSFFSFLFPRAKHADIEGAYLNTRPLLKFLLKPSSKGLLLTYNFSCLMLNCNKCNKLLNALDLSHKCNGWLEQVEEKYNEWFKEEKNGNQTTRQKTRNKRRFIFRFVATD